MLWTTDELVGTDPATRARLIERFRESSQIVYVANTTERSQHITDITAAGFAPSATNVVWVFRDSAPLGSKVEYTTNGTTWIPEGGTHGAAVASGANAEVTVSHGLPYAPAAVICTVNRPGSGSDTVASLANVVVWAVTATTFTVRAYRRDTDALFANNNVGFYWHAR